MMVFGGREWLQVWFKMHLKSMNFEASVAWWLGMA